MKSIKDSLFTLIISIIVLIGGFCLLEKHYHNELLKLGWLPVNKLNLYPYGRRISGYTVCENTPNYSFMGYDDKFRPATVKTDSNGFKTDGMVLRAKKDSNTIRIFITGGSMAWGSIEARDIMKDTTYPVGTYCYEATIAGKLKALLQSKYPQFKFEVIDAAVVGFRFHQSFALYYEKLHDFKPDIIINIDGQNDNFTEDDNHGDPYPATMDQIDEELELASLSRLPQWPYTLVFYNFKYVRKHGRFAEKRKPSLQLISHDNTIIEHEPDIKSYELIKPFIKISQKIQWIVDSYERQLHSDSVYSIFCLQPLLKRWIYQKQLSPTELRFRTFLEKKITVADTMNMRASMSEIINSFPTLRDAGDSVIAKMGVDIYWMSIMGNHYFLNDISPVLDSIVHSNGGDYIDINKAMTRLGADKEFYVDYCHLTPFGNEFIAELLMEKVEVFLGKRKQGIKRSAS